MQQEKHDEEIERYLSKFQPRAIRPLDIPRRNGNPQLRWLAAVAVLAFAGYVALSHRPRETSQSTGVLASRAIGEVLPGEFRRSKQISTSALTELALDDVKAFDAVLNDESRSMFPNMRQEQSALRVLAKP